MNPSSPSNPTPGFFGQRASAPNVNVYNATPNQMLYELNLNTGTQSFFGTNGTINFGLFNSAITGAQGIGQQIVDNNGNVLFEMNGQTWYWFDTEGNNIMQVGLLPDGTYGWAVATPGNSVGDAY